MENGAVQGQSTPERGISSGLQPYLQKGSLKEAPTILSGMPRASRMADKSWDPKPPSNRHILVESGVMGTPHSTDSAWWIMSEVWASLSLTASGEKSAKTLGNVPD